MESRANFADLLDPVIRKVYYDQEKQIKETRPMIFHEIDSTKNQEKDSTISGLSQLQPKAEGTPVQYEDVNAGYKVTYVHTTFALGTQVTKELWDDDQHNQIRRKPENLAKARVRHSESVGADIFNYAFTSGGGGKATFTAGDAVALCSASHTRTDGGANLSNTTTADFAEDAMEVALVNMRQTLDNKGQLVLIQPSHLIIPPALNKEANILLKSTERTGTANNDINPYEGALTPIVWEYIGSAGGGSDTAWFVIDQSAHLLNWFWRQRPELDGPDYDFDTKSGKWSVLYRASVGFSDWRGVYGSKGDNS